MTDLRVMVRESHEPSLVKRLGKTGDPTRGPPFFPHAEAIHRFGRASEASIVLALSLGRFSFARTG